MDRIIVDKIVCYGHHGVLPEEQILGQEFQISFELGLDLSTHSEDRLDSVPDYRKAISIVEEVIYSEPCQLLETIACHIADKLLQLPKVAEVTVEVCKPNPPIPGVQGGVSAIVNRIKR